jgi:hypothetical protein
LRNGLAVPISVGKAPSMLSPQAPALDDHAIARQRRMYARLLFVVVGIFGRLFPDFGGFGP